MKKIINNQSGRSMVEMLGVLAIIGVLSIGGVAGYAMAMQKFRTNQAIEAVQLIMTETRTLFGAQESYDGLGASTTAGTPAETVTSNIGMAPPFGGITVNQGTDTGVTNFTVLVEDVPEASCVALATSNWGTMGSGYVQLSIGSTANPSWTVAQATTTCNTAAGSTDEVDMTWTFR